MNGQATSSTGDTRQYVSRDLTAGYNYTYEVRAEIVRDGRTVEQVKKVDLRAGEAGRGNYRYWVSIKGFAIIHADCDDWSCVVPCWASGRPYPLTNIGTCPAWELGRSGSGQNRQRRGYGR